MKRKLILFLLISLCAAWPLLAQEKASLARVTFEKEGYALGVEHGKHFKTEIDELVEKWDANLAAYLQSKGIEKSTEQVLKAFFAYAQFTPTIKKWMPELYQEMQGIAEGAGQPLQRIFVLNLLDEFWFYLANPKHHHCSDVGVPARDGNPAYVAQNMDIEKYTQGYQTLVRLAATENRPEQLILTHPGLIGLNGMNERGVGICVNTLMQLTPNAAGAPVAFIVRKLVSMTDKEALLNFIQEVPHASGQNYILGIREEVFDFEASANKVVRFMPKNENGTLYHTNHPMVNDDLNTELDWVNPYNPTLPMVERPTKANSYRRFAALETRMTTQTSIGAEGIKATLRSRDDAEHPVCRSFQSNSAYFTFVSTIMTLTDEPFLEITAGAPNQLEYKKVYFSSQQK